MMPALLTRCQSCNQHHEDVYWNKRHGWLCDLCEVTIKCLALAELDELPMELTELPSRCGHPQDDGAPVEDQ